MSFKFSFETAQVVLKSVEWGVGEEHISPVAQFDPVQIDGVMVERASLHNPQWMLDNKVAVGSILTIERRGGVIPKVIDVNNVDNKETVIPDTCPSCGKPVKWCGKFIACSNPECDGKCLNKLIRGLSVFGIKGVGPALAEKAYQLTGAKDIMSWIDWFGDKDDGHIAKLMSLSKVIDNEPIRFTKNEVSVLTRLANVKTDGVTMQQLLASVCIPKCSTEFVSTVDTECGGISELLKTVPVDRMYDRIVNHCKLDAVTNFMLWIENEYERFIDYCRKFKVVEPEKKQTFLKTISFTGTGPKPRHVCQSIAMSKGYLPTENAGNCNILVAADPNGNSGKLKRARAKGVRIISYEDFLSL